MLSDMLRTTIWCALGAIIVGWWVPQLYAPPRWLPTPDHKRYTDAVPPHLDPSRHTETPDVDNVKHLTAVNHAHAQWAVQIGSYRSLKSIQSTIDALKAKGFTVVVKAVETPQGPLYRIWVGNLAHAQEATQLAETLKKQFHIQGFVLRLED